MGTGEADDVVSGRSHDRQWAVLMSATGQLRGRLRAVSRGRRQRATYLGLASWALQPGYSMPRGAAGGLAR